MAKALQCPNCGTRKRLDDLAGAETFACDGCGRVTKVPPGAHDHHHAADGRPAPRPAPRPAEQAASRSATPPVPKRRSRPSARAAAAGAGLAAGAAAPAAAGGSTAVGGVIVSSPPTSPPTSPPSPARPGTERAAPSTRRLDDRGPRPVKRRWRVLAWLVALPIALAVVGIPARAGGYLTSQRLLDVIVARGIDRFVPILVIVVLWAIVTAILVTVLVAVGQRLAARRRARSSD